MEKQQSEKETQKHRDEFTSHELYTIHEGATGATEEDSNSTNGEDRARNKDDGLILEEGEIVEDEEKNTEAKGTSDESEELCAIGVADAEAKQRQRELDTEIEDTQNQIENCQDDDQREDLEKQMMVYMGLKEELLNGEEEAAEEMPMEEDEKEGSVPMNGVEGDDVEILY